MGAEGCKKSGKKSTRVKPQGGVADSVGCRVEETHHLKRVTRNSANDSTMNTSETACEAMDKAVRHSAH